MKKLKFPNINTIVLTGRVTRELELRYTTKGTQTLSIPLAFSRSYKGKNDEWVQETSYVDVIVWGAMAERAAVTLGKGSPISVEGSLRTRMYTAKDGHNVRVTEVLAKRVLLLEKDELVDGQTADNKDAQGFEPWDVAKKNSTPAGAGAAAGDDERVPF